MDLVYREKWRQPCRVRLKAYRGQTSPRRPRQTLEAEGQSARAPASAFTGLVFSDAPSLATKLLV